MTVELVDVAEGLWLWRQPHPDWEEGNDWDPLVTSVAVASRGASARCGSGSTRWRPRPR